MTGNKQARATVNMLWIGGSLGGIERLSILSWLRQDHPVRLHAYGPVANVPAGVEPADAALIVPWQQIKRLRHRKTGSYALASDYFRYSLQLAGAGLWSDADVVCLKPVELEGACLFGRQHDGLINGAILHLDPALPMTAELEQLFRDDVIPPWTIAKRTRRARLKRALRMRVTPADLPWGTYGPAALTALARKHGVFDRARPAEVFYPLDFRAASKLFDPAFSLDGVLTENTLTLHLWNEVLRDRKHTKPPKGSPMAALYSEFGV